MKPSCSIVIPLRRQRDEWLSECLQSALDQTVPCEVIVVTHPHTPASNLRILDGFVRRHDLLHVCCQPAHRPNFPGAINRGFETARTARIGLLLSDDWLEPTAAEECLACSTDIVSTSNTKYAEDGVTTYDNAHRSYSLRAYLLQETLEAKADYLRHFFVFQRDALLDVGGVDESIGLTGPDDYDLIWTLLEHGATVSLVEKSLYNKRDHDGERLTMRSYHEQLVDIEKIFDKHGMFGTDRERLIARMSPWFGKPVHAVAEPEVDGS